MATSRLLVVFASALLLESAGWEKNRVDYEPHYQVKAACLFGFAKFVEWPQGDISKQFTIGILGKDPFGEIIDKLVQQKNINGRPVIVRRLQRPEQARECDLVYLGSPELLDGFLQAVEKASVLTVGESEPFTRAGGMIGFVLVEDHVGFDVNTANVARSGLQVSSRLLQLAHRVIASGHEKATAR